MPSAPSLDEYGFDEAQINGSPPTTVGAGRPFGMRCNARTCRLHACSCRAGRTQQPCRRGVDDECSTQEGAHILKTCLDFSTPDMTCLLVQHGARPRTWKDITAACSFENAPALGAYLELCPEVMSSGTSSG